MYRSPLALACFSLVYHKDVFRHPFGIAGVVASRFASEGPLMKCERREDQCSCLTFPVPFQSALT